MDRDVFEQLYQKYYAPALLYAQSLCRGRHLAEDMVQEAFYRAWLSLPDDVRTPRPCTGPWRRWRKATGSC